MLLFGSNESSSSGLQSIFHIPSMLVEPFSSIAGIQHNSGVALLSPNQESGSACPF